MLRRDNDVTTLWPQHRHEIIDWLVKDVHEQRFIDNLLVDLCARLASTGVPVARAALVFRTNYPQWLGARILWQRGASECEIRGVEYGIERTPGYIGSPVEQVEKGADFVRHRIFDDKPGASRHMVYDELAAEGMTDYVALVMHHTLGKRQVVTFATDAPQGFRDDEIDLLKDVTPLVSSASEIRIKNHLARMLLETYVGKQASNEILAGATRRGSGSTVQAAVMICDLRDFTALSDALPRDSVLSLLNDYFDTVTEPIERHGGEILKFMGDGLLAIFPLSRPTAAEDLLAAVKDASKGLQALSAARLKHGREPLSWGVGVHAGDVMYGNIGSASRLDFTVVGPAVNVASRLERLTKDIGRPVLMSQDFASLLPDSDTLERLGPFRVRGLGAPIEVFAPVNDQSAKPPPVS
ncbi:adenylate/guanylate cyclase domain-containing protein [Rhizobium jaguaris]|uniref:Adenylate/guanylate cyclase domain-containing protein n=1 Tax=Rhizobium jaguaris TaxID=1312183 RepID=A0A387FWS6_9HYPH|nr:adenylate/guanylate cyclase domain-containing protein [Rhizobium jaguaris]AYG59982.1 adenylate/guanylate cyclase domain-containing protein [Rhizobium jaguaris]